jgi:hypothetical protein
VSGSEIFSLLDSFSGYNQVQVSEEYRLITTFLIQVDISGHPPFPTDSKQFSGNFGNLLFLAVFWVLKLPEPF